MRKGRRLEEREARGGGRTAGEDGSGRSEGYGYGWTLEYGNRNRGPDAGTGSCGGRPGGRQRVGARESAALLSLGACGHHLSKLHAQPAGPIRPRGTARRQTHLGSTPLEAGREKTARSLHLGLPVLSGQT